MSKKRKYDENYVSYGFCCMKESDGTEKPQCFLCGKVLANASMKPAKLIEHLKSLHPENASKDLDYFTKKKAQFSKSGTLPKLGFSTPKKPLVEASYKVAYRIAKSKKPHNIGETLIKPCALEMVELVCGLEQRKKLEAIPLSNDVIHSRIVEISCNILKQIIDELKTSPFPFSIQLDETTDISNCSQLLVFVRYISADTVKEEFLFCEPLLQTTKAVDVLAMLNGFFDRHDFNWKQKLHSICADGAPAMLGNKSGFAQLVKKDAPHILVTHCFLHRHALATKTLPRSLKEVLSIVIKTVNFIRSRALNHRLFKTLCQEMSAEHEVLLYHTEVRWLSRGQVLKRIFMLKTELSLFLEEKGNPLFEYYKRKDFTYKLAYLADIFSHMNEISLSIQGHDITIMDATEKLQAFLLKMPLWKTRVQNGIYANFQMLDETLSKNEFREITLISKDLENEICEHLEALQWSFKKYFNLDEENTKDEMWIRNPFLCDIDCIDDLNIAKDELIDLRTKSLLRMDFNSKTLGEFWCSVKEAYPLLVRRAMDAIIPFATVYLCETGFSTLVAIKTKQRNRLNVEHDMRVALSKTIPEFDLLINTKQQQPSH